MLQKKRLRLINRPIFLCSRFFRFFTPIYIGMKFLQTYIRFFFMKKIYFCAAKDSIYLFCSLFFHKKKFTL